MVCKEALCEVDFVRDHFGWQIGLSENSQFKVCKSGMEENLPNGLNTDNECGRESDDGLSIDTDHRTNDSSN
jgi:hypothetical protein